MNRKVAGEFSVIKKGWPRVHGPLGDLLIGKNVEKILFAVGKTRGESRKKEKPRMGQRGKKLGTS